MPLSLITLYAFQNTMAAQTLSDPLERLQIVLNPDGSITRRSDPPSTEPTPTYDPNNPICVLSKDVKFDPSNNDAWFRVYHPRQPPQDGAKLPVVFYYHGGGFVFCSPANTVFHVFCSDMAALVPAVVGSFKYRLAPEHRLPAAYDDAMHALHWIKTNPSKVDWLRDHADLTDCFFMGNSAGGNLAYHVGLRAAAAATDLEPIKIKGLILHHPFFGGTQRTPTELRLVNDPVLPPCVSDLIWELALPVGADRDHEFCNPTAGGGSKDVEKMRVLGWKVLVAGFEGDPLYDHQTALAKMLEHKGVAVGSTFKEGGEHGLEISHASKAMPFHVLVKNFITQC